MNVLYGKMRSLVLIIFSPGEIPIWFHRDIEKTQVIEITYSNGGRNV